MKYLSLFSGIGAFEKALDRLKKQYELVGYCEIDKYASKSYSAIHNVSESLNLGDITKVNEKTLPKDIDLITYGFPCQDISIAGKQKGLFFEALRIITETRPKVAIAENVKNLAGKTFKKQFEIVLDSLDAAGYNNYWQVLNAKDFGIPQNRERVFIVSIRKDIDAGQFFFPNGFDLELRLIDLIERTTEQKYYINPDLLQISEEAIASALETKKHSANIEMVGLLNIKGNEQTRRVYGVNGIAPTLNTMQGGNRQPKIMLSKAFLGCDKSRNNPQIIDIANCITAREDRGVINRRGEGTAIIEVTKEEILIRKLTPKECFRLMGFDDEAFKKAQKVNSNAQLYKQAGNSIVVNVLYYIFQQLQNAGIL